MFSVNKSSNDRRFCLGFSQSLWSEQHMSLIYWLHGHIGLLMGRRDFGPVAAGPPGRTTHCTTSRNECLRSRAAFRLFHSVVSPPLGWTWSAKAAYCVVGRLSLHSTQLERSKSHYMFQGFFPYSTQAPPQPNERAIDVEIIKTD